MTKVTGNFTMQSTS